MAIQHSQLITRKQLSALTGGKIDNKRYGNPLKMGTPFNYAGGSAFAKANNRIHNICIRQSMNHPLPESVDQVFEIYRTSKGPGTLPKDIECLKDGYPNHPSIPIFWQPTDQNGFRDPDGKAKGVYYVGHWKVNNVETFKDDPIPYLGHDRSAKVQLKFHNYDLRMSNIIDACHKKKYNEIGRMSFDDMDDDDDDEEEEPENIPLRVHQCATVASPVAGSPNHENEEETPDPVDSAARESRTTSIPSRRNNTGTVRSSSRKRREVNYSEDRELRNQQSSNKHNKKKRQSLPSEPDVAADMDHQPRRRRRQRLGEHFPQEETSGQPDSADYNLTQSQQEVAAAAAAAAQLMHPNEHSARIKKEEDQDDDESVVVVRVEEAAIVGEEAQPQWHPRPYIFQVVFFDDDDRKNIIQVPPEPSITFADLRQAINDQLSLEDDQHFSSFQFTLAGFNLDIKQEYWSVYDNIIRESTNDGTLQNPYQINIKPK